MKRPCPMCKKIIDDGLPYPEGSDPEMIKKSHKVCKYCLPDFNRYAAEQMKIITAMKLMKGEI